MMSTIKTTIKTIGVSRRVQHVGVLLVVLAALALPMQALAGVHVPLKGSDAGTWGPGIHACGTLFPVRVDGAGVASQVGSYTYASQECVDFGVYPFALLGIFTITAANGDAVIGTYTGTAVFADDGVTILYEQQVSVTGGTGRFAQANGQLAVTGIASSDGTYVQRVTGVKTSVGASKH